MTKLSRRVLFAAFALLALAATAVAIHLTGPVLPHGGANNTRAYDDSCLRPPCDEYERR
jgi:hypothetical protein